MFHLVPYWLVNENPIYNINRFVLQECGKVVEGCLTVKNQCGLLTGGDSQTKKGYENYDLSMTQEVCGNVDYKTLFQHHHHQLPHIHMLINFPKTISPSTTVSFYPKMDLFSS